MILFTPSVPKKEGLSKSRIKVIILQQISESFQLLHKNMFRQLKYTIPTGETNFPLSVLTLEKGGEPFKGRQPKSLHCALIIFTVSAGHKIGSIVR